MRGLVLAGAVVAVLLLAVGLVTQLRKPAATTGPVPVDAGAARADRAARVTAPASRPRPVRIRRDGGLAATPPRAVRTQWPTKVSQGAARPPMGGFDKWTGDEFYRPDEIQEAARARGVGLDLFRESKRAFWLAQLTTEWSVLTEMGLSDSIEVRSSLANLSSTALEEVERLLTAAAKREMSEDVARARIRRLEDRYRKEYCAASGMTPEAFERFFEPSLVPQP